MAGGKNKKFMKEREHFVEKHIIEVVVSPAKLIDVAAHHTDPSKAVDATKGRVAIRGAVGTAQRNTGIYEFDLIDTKNKGTVTKNGKDCSVPIIELHAWGEKERDFKSVAVEGRNTLVNQYSTPKHAHPIRAYWAPWDTNTAWSVQLGADADYFFTQTMDGCSLGISSGANPVVTHGNYRSHRNPDKASETRTVRAIQDHHTNTLGVDVAKWLKKDQYVATSAEKTLGINRLVTVIGFRDPVAGGWDFYWQRRKVDNTGPVAKIILQDRLVPIV